MLTVSAKDLDGSETIFQARHVIACRVKGSDNVKRVECYDERYEPISVCGNAAIEFGTVFVMNDNGKTVATYYLSQM